MIIIGLGSQRLVIRLCWIAMLVETELINLITATTLSWMWSMRYRSNPLLKQMSMNRLITPMSITFNCLKRCNTKHNPSTNTTQCVTYLTVYLPTLIKCLWLVCFYIVNFCKWLQLDWDPEIIESLVHSFLYRCSWLTNNLTVRLLAY